MSKTRDEDWAEAKRRCRLTQEAIGMAKELGMSPSSLIKNVPSQSQQWSFGSIFPPPPSSFFLQVLPDIFHGGGIIRTFLGEVNRFFEKNDDLICIVIKSV
jgi:hypothetical protein